LGLLAEKRRALITRAVTRGLDPRAALRDSGIPWLGEIPAHWTATRMKFLATEPLAYGANEAALEDDPTFPRFVRITDVDSEGNLRDETFKSLPPEVAEPYLLRDGDVLLARSGATVGKAFIYKPAWGIACFAGYLIRCRCNTVLMQPDFLFAYTQTEPYWWQVREGTIQATIQNFSAEKYGDLVVTVPPLEEQKAIIAHITAETAKLDALRAATERTIALLKERRAALIAAAVTGKLDVQGAERHLDVVAD
jgi:type I restriction enzyme, S subunit